MKYKKTKSPFIIPFMYYFFGILFILVIIAIVCSQVENIIESIPMLIILFGFCILCFVIGYRRMKR